MEDATKSLCRGLRKIAPSRYKPQAPGRPQGDITPFLLRRIKAYSTIFSKSSPESKKPRKLSPSSTVPIESSIGMSDGFCIVCSKMIEDCFRSFTIYTSADAHPVMIWRSRDFHESDIDIIELAGSYKHSSCGFCGFLLSVLRGPDGAFLHQVKRYTDDNFRPKPAYDENGISDHEAGGVYEWNWNRVNLKLGLKLQCLTSSERIDQLEMRMHLSYRMQRKRSTQTQALPNFVHRCLPVFLATDNPNNDNPTTLTNRDPRKNSSEKIEMILAWLARHEIDATMDMTTLPTRLLDITDISRIKLVEYNSLSRPYSIGEALTCFSVRYAALSHRWGTSRHLITTSENFQTLQNGVDLWELPRNFGNATLFALQLGIHYLWIDALCIVQDDPGDWYRESQKMGDIFTNAAVTLAVHSAKDDSGGFLSETLSKLPILEHRCQVGTIGICLPPQPENDVTNSDLSKRGWVLQERFLSQRTIHLTRGQIYLESHKGLLCEDGTLLNEPLHQGSAADGTKPKLYDPHALQDLRRCLGLALDQVKPYQVAETTLQWLCVVEVYSRCDLTRETDKLVAIAGMARKIHRITTQIWCAGLWADHICQSLLWCPTTSGITAPQDPRAPSWSWAFWDGAIQYPMNVWHTGFQPRSVFQRVCSGGEEFSETSWLNGPGQLVLRGRLVPLPALLIRDCSKFGPGPARKEKLFSIPHAKWNDYVYVSGICCEDTWGVLPIDGWAIFDHNHTDDLRFTSPGTENLLQPLGWGAQFLILGTHLVDQQLLCLGIFLVRSRGRHSQIYKRMGVGHLEWDYIWHCLSTDSANSKKAHKTTVNWSAARWAFDLANTPANLDSLFAKDKLTEVFIE